MLLRRGKILARFFSHQPKSRNAAYKKINDQDIKYFKSILTSAGSVLTNIEDCKSYNTDWMNKFHGKSNLVLRPKTTEQVSKIMSYCNKEKLAVVPQGGNTGLVGGSIPLFDEIVLSLSLMDNIISFDEVSGIVISQSGVILEKLDNWLKEKDHMMPLDLGAKGSCQVGGNVSTNAGGLRLVRYGSLHGTVLGVEVVQADGTVLDLLTSLRKDNTGYDLKQLFIGAEGTLGIITKVSILCPRRPLSVNVAFFGVSDYKSVQNTLVAAKRGLGEILSAVEFLDRGSMELVLKHVKGSRDPLSAPFPFYVLIETAGSNPTHDGEKLNAFLEKVMEEGTVHDGIVAQDESQAKALWVMREEITSSLSKQGGVYKYDLSMPVSTMYDLVEEMKEKLKPLGANVVGYGHLGDGNLHLNISVPKLDDKYLNEIEPFVYEWTSKQKGSISAEHGLGQMKANYMHFSKPKEAIQVMSNIKKSLDPNYILNPYKVLPDIKV